MSICSSTCFLCESIDVYSINFSNLHKACLQHLNEITFYENYNNLPSPIVSCIWCETKVLVIWDICRCKFCFEVTCKARKCGHTNCMKGYTKCPECPERSELPVNPECLKCTKCGNYDDNLENGICPDCYNMPTCPQCEKQAITYKKACDHMACKDCYHKQDCKMCNNVQICSYCQNKCTNMFPYNCNHKKCENCYLDSCTLCMKEKLENFPPCNNCGEKAESHVKDCKHIGCVICKDTCYKCNPKCSNCKNATVPDIIMKCGHYGCVKCSEIFCYTCHEYISKIKYEDPEYTKRKLNEAKQDQIKLCVNCGRRENPANLNCGHTGCSGCLYENKCRECENKWFHSEKKSESLGRKSLAIDFPECENCNEKNELLLKKCHHLGCVKCREYCIKCGSKCTNCNSSGFSNKKMICGHFGCRTCSETFCYTCNKYIHEMSSPIKPCLNCGKQLKETLLYCNHKGCTGCYGTPCKKCSPEQLNYERTIKPCPNCGNQLKETFLICNHRGCIGCYGTPCIICDLEQQNCENCLKPAKLPFKAKCGHFSCENCIELFCKQCSKVTITPQTCPDCGEKNELITLKCMHKTCKNCSYKNSCSQCTKKTSNCANCHKPYYELTKFPCNHNGCENCNFGGCILCSSPRKTKQSLCKSCGKITEGCLMRCGHMGCKDCEKMLKCKICAAYKGCANCGSISFKKIELNCGHMGCEGCEDKLCKECGKEQKDKTISKCAVCNEQESEVKLKCGHPSCRRCSFSNVNCPSCDKVISYRCENCKIQKNDTNALACKHRLCKICSDFLNYCPTCFPNKLAQKCVVCKKTSEDFIACHNKHNMCLKCFEKYGKCPKCPKKCTFCNREINDSTLLNCSAHFSCKSCLVIHKICKKCPIICCSCNIITENYLLQPCKHPQCPLCLQNRKSCIKCDPSPSESTTVSSQRISITYELCSCCSNKLYHSKALPCSHKACESCHNLSKKCTKCPASPIKKEVKCGHCNSKLATIDAVCNHKICFSCFDTNKLCPNTKLCNSCYENPATETEKCGHDVCESCVERTGNCGPCRLKMSNNKCPHCLRNASNLMLFKCRHDGCSSCMNNGFCFSCIKTRNLFNNDQVGVICYKCQDFSGIYVTLICNHRLCSKCFVEDYKNFGFMCPECALGSLEAVCVYCKDFTSWEIDGNIVRSSSCCRRIFCKECCGEIKPNKAHQCT